MSNLKLVPYTNSKGLLAVRAETSAIDLSQLSLTSDLVLYNTNYVKPDGTIGQGTMPQQTGTITLSGSTSTTLPAGYYNGNTVTLGNTDLANLIAANIKAGVPILGVTGSYTGEMIMETIDIDASVSDTRKYLSRTTSNRPLTHNLGVKPKRWYLFQVSSSISDISDNSYYGTSATAEPVLTMYGHFDSDGTPIIKMLTGDRYKSLTWTSISASDYTRSNIIITATASTFDIKLPASNGSYTHDIDYAVFGKHLPYRLFLYA